MTHAYAECFFKSKAFHRLSLKLNLKRVNTPQTQQHKVCVGETGESSPFPVPMKQVPPLHPSKKCCAAGHKCPFYAITTDSGSSFGLGLRHTRPSDRWFTRPGLLSAAPDWCSCLLWPNGAGMRCWHTHTAPGKDYRFTQNTRRLDVLHRVHNSQRHAGMYVCIWVMRNRWDAASHIDI